MWCLDWILKSAIIPLLCIMLTGCMVGPNFHRPPAPVTDTYTGAPQPLHTARIAHLGKAGKPQHFVWGEDIPQQWWILFHSPALNKLIRIGMRNSPNIASAEAALRQAQQTYWSQWGTLLFPNVNLQVNGVREKFSGASIGSASSSIFNNYTAQVNVGYTLDFFGGARRQLEALAAQIDFQRYELAAAYLSLTSNIVTTTISIASFRAQIKATLDLIVEQRQQLHIIREQYRLGGVSEQSVLTQETLLEQTRAGLQTLKQNLAQAQHALSVLIGEVPDERSIPAFDLYRLKLPTNLPVSLPSVLVRQRPDILASEALLHAASAQIGVATANLFPSFTLNGNYGYVGNTLAHLFRSGNSIWSYGATITQSIFTTGSLLAARQAAIAAYDQACAQYRQTVLQAFQNVADSLRALQHDALALRAQRRAEIAASNGLQISEQQYHLGGASYLTLLIAQQQYRQTVIARIQAQATRYTDTAALFQALGGGWWEASYRCVKNNSGKMVFVVDQKKLASGRYS